MASELGPPNIHVARLVIDAGVDTAWVRERIRARSGAEAADGLEPDRLGGEIFFGKDRSREVEQAILSSR
jgi:hypothetical protein